MKYCKRGHLRTPENIESGRGCKKCRALTDKARADAVFERLAAGEVVVCKNGHMLHPKIVSTRCGDCLLCREAVNKAHYEATRTRPSIKLVCKNGHPRTPETTNKRNTCLICVRATAKRTRERRKRSRQRMELFREYSRIWANGKRRRDGAPEAPWNSRRERERPESYGGVRLDSAVFLSFLEDWLERNPGVTISTIAERAGSSIRAVNHWRHGSRISIESLQRWLDAMDAAPDALEVLYGELGPAPPPRKRRQTRQVCDFRGCKSSRGHGPLGGMCAEHGPLFDRLKAEFEAGEGWKNNMGRRDPDYEPAWGDD